ncbi:uncharacterized protein N7498_008163 [Penicillium cinerascens]|uniref:Uncharacterized protein n=1 Tax=Penicillium cinerascens TaxID=70096 RepID=A0A9W9M9X7_9EURO|nr:uncharacterized protein N7498_008163 [Penicillium cinerascens]KAJ5194725.1 hypothetical protein N7498_008163 [Penicillium cinerascens]
MFGPFPSCLVAPADEPCSPSKSPGRSSVRRSLDTAVKSPVTEAHHPAPDPGPPPITPGNAFSIIARREWEKGRVRGKSFGSSEPSSPTEELQRPGIYRKSSYLDYDEELALPMPKPRHERADTPSLSTGNENETGRPGLLKNRSATDPIFVSTPSHSEPSTPDDVKKRSKLDLIKSKLSFKDLRKEASTEDTSKSFISHPMPQLRDVPALPSSESSKRRFRRAASPGGFSSMSQSNYNFKAKLKPIDQGKISGPALQTNTTPSKIPLPPSGGFTNAHGIMAPSRIPSRRVSSTESQSSSPTQDSNKDKSNAEDKTGAIAPTGKRPNLTISRTSMDVGQKVRTSYEAPNYPVTKDSPPVPGDLLEGSGKVKYLPRHWVEQDSAPSVPPKPDGHAPTAYEENEPPITAIPDYLPSFKERLEKADIPLEGLVSPIRSIPMQVDDLVDTVRSIQRQTETGVSNLTKKLDELSNWIGDQLQNQVDSISDLARTKAELHSKQFDISREMMKFQMDVRLEIGVMERRLNNFEMKVMDEVQAEIRALARSYEDLNRKTEALITKFSSDDLHEFIECQRRKTEEIQKEVGYLKAQDDKLKLDETQTEQIIRCVKAQMEAVKGASAAYPITPTKIEILNELSSKKTDLATPLSQKTDTPTTSLDVHRYSESTIRSTPPLVRDLDRALPLPPTPASIENSLLTRPRASAAQEPKPTGTFPRSLSMTKKGFLTGVKDAVSSASEVREKPMEKKSSSEGKKWSVFGFRRRRDGHETSTTSSGKHSRSSIRRLEGTLLLDDGRSHSRTSTPTPPIPAIPRDVSKSVQKGNTLSTIHPALRAATIQNSMHKDEALSSKSCFKPIVPTQPRFSCDIGSNGSTRGSIPSTCTPATSFGEAHFQPGSDNFHSTMQEKQSLKKSHHAEDSLKVPLLGDTDHGWDRASLRESRSNDTLN